MKFKYILGAFAAAALFCIAGCEKDPSETHPEGLELSVSYVSIPVSGNSVEVTIDSDKAWEFDTTQTANKIPTWLTVSPMSGDAGQNVITFTADAVDYGREVELKIVSDKVSQYLQVKQGVNTPSPSTCADVIAGADGKQYQVTGVCTAIANTTYGNWYINDGTGEVYVYGTLDKNGAEKNFASLGIELGDVVTISGPKTTYGTTIELVNVNVLNIEKSLIKLVETSADVTRDGEEVSVKVAYKGSGAYFSVAEEAQSWVVFKSSDYIAGVPSKLEKNPADTCVFTFNVLENDGEFSRSAEIEFFSKKGSNASSGVFSIAQEGNSYEAVSLADFLTKPDDNKKAYQVEGVVSKINMDNNDPTKPNKFGNFDIKDNTATAYIYGLLPEKGGLTGQDVITARGIKVGDYLRLASPKSSYNGSAQGNNAWILAHYPGKTNAEFVALEDDTTKSEFYTVSGTVTEIVMDNNDPTQPNKYGNIYINDGETTLYVYGVLDWDGTTANFASLKLAVGDKITGYAYKSSYKGTNQAINLQPVIIEKGE